jgi:hypothetical protein
VKYACIEAYRGQNPVRIMCRALDVTRSGYYAWRQREPSARERQDTPLRVAIRGVFQKSRRRYGSPRIHRALKTMGLRTSCKHVARLMRESPSARPNGAS